MKTRAIPLMFFCLLLCGGIAKSATITWANTNGGNWNVATNWNPAQVPVSGDNVIITTNGTYTITNGSSATLGNLTLGGTNGIQTLVLSSLTLTNIGLVNSNGVFYWNGGEVDVALTVAPGGVLNLTNNTTYYVYGSFTNNGTVNWSAGSLYGYGPPGNKGLIYNAGLWNAQSDGTLAIGGGAPVFINTGTFQKSGSTGGSTTIGWNFNSTGTFLTQTGSLSCSTWVGNSTVNGNYTGSATVNTGVNVTVATNAMLNWNNGGEVDGALTVAPGGVLNLTNNTTYYIRGSLTNNGTVNWSAGSIYGYGPPSYTGLIYNAGLWNAQFDGTLSMGGGLPVFINIGTLQKSGGTGTTTINWNFTSTGVLNVQTGSFSIPAWVGNNTLNGNYAGTIGVNSNATVNVPANVTVNWTGGTIAQGGVFNVASNGIVNWSAGEIDGVVTVAQGGVLNITNSSTYTFYGSLTNNGTVNWSAGSLYGYGPPSYTGLIYNAGLWNVQFDGTFTSGSGTPIFINTGTFQKSGSAGGSTTISWNFNSTGTFNTQTGLLSCSTWVGNSTVNGNYTGSATVNTGVSVTVATNATMNWNGGQVSGALTVAQGAVLNLTNNTTYTIFGSLTNNGTVNWSAGSIYGYGPPSYNGLIYNAGLWNAQFDGTLTAASGTPSFINIGTLQKIGGTGTTTINWNFTSTGILNVQTGSFSIPAWMGNNTVNGNYTGTIGVNSNATVNVPANVTVNWTGGTIAQGGVFNVASNGIVNWSAGEIDGMVTVAQGGILSITNNSTYTIFGSLTNNGTVNWSAGSIYGYGPPSYTGLIYNAGLWNVQFDGTFTAASGTPSFINIGTFQKSGGTGTTTINWNFNSTGTFNTQTGLLSCSTWVGNSTVNGNYTGSATVNTGVSVTVATNGALNWTSGGISGALTVAMGGKLNLTNNTTYTIFGSLTNNGTVNWSAGSIYGYGPPSYNGLIYNAGLWNAQFDGTFTAASGTPAFLNTGTFRKTAGLGGTTTINWNFTNSVGILDSQTNAISLATSYNLTGGTLNFGINNRTNYGTISLAGAAPLTGTVSANLNNGYLPIGGNAFTNLFYSSFTGIFTNTSLPFADAWSTNYHSTFFVLNVLNARPVIVAPTNNQFVVNELTTLTVTNSATDADIPGQNLAYSLVDGTNGIVVNSATGILTWTPQQTNSPSTNTISVAVTDNGVPPLSATNTYSVIVKEVNVPPSLPVISTQIVNELTLLTVANTATNFNIHSIITGYTLVNPPSNMVINASGVITWTPAQAQSPATNLITTIVTNSNPYDLTNPTLTSTNSFTVIVREVNVPASLPVISTQIVNELTMLTVANTATNFNIHSIITGYTLVNPPNNMVINASGVITWTPTQTQSPATNLITTIVTNSNPYDLINPTLTSTNSITVIVREVNQAPALGIIGPHTITLLQPFSLTNNATEPNIHSITAGYVLLSPPAGAAINASGTISWTPVPSQTLSTNTITTLVTNSNPYDLVNPHLSATNSFSVIVLPNTVATNLTALNSGGNSLTLGWPADHTGWRLEIQTNKLTMGLGTNWATFMGSSATNQEMIGTVKTNQTVFFRMAYP